MSSMTAISNNVLINLMITLIRWGDLNHLVKREDERFSIVLAYE